MHNDTGLAHYSKTCTLLFDNQPSKLRSMCRGFAQLTTNAELCSKFIPVATRTCKAPAGSSSERFRYFCGQLQCCVYPCTTEGDILKTGVFGVIRIYKNIIMFIIRFKLISINSDVQNRYRSSKLRVSSIGDN